MPAAWLCKAKVEKINGKKSYIKIVLELLDGLDRIYYCSKNEEKMTQTHGMVISIFFLV